MSAATPEPRHDRGSSSISIAILFPLVAVLTLALAQTVIVSAASAVALSAAEEGLRVARARNGSAGRGRVAATDFARHFPMLLDPSVTISGSTTIIVTVHGHAPSVVPGLHRTITETARGPRERVTTETRGFTKPEELSATNLSSGGMR